MQLAKTQLLPDAQSNDYIIYTSYMNKHTHNSSKKKKLDNIQKQQTSPEQLAVVLRYKNLHYIIRVFNSKHRQQPPGQLVYCCTQHLTAAATVLLVNSYLYGTDNVTPAPFFVPRCSPRDNDAAVQSRPYHRLVAKDKATNHTTPHPSNRLSRARQPCRKNSDGTAFTESGFLKTITCYL